MGSLLPTILGITAGVVGTVYGVRRLQGWLSNAPPAPDAPEALGPVDRSKDAIHKAARPIIEVAVKRVVARDGTEPELQYVQGVAYVETNYGRGWSGAGIGSNNWGAVQCPANAQDGPDCFPYQDSQSSGEKYKIAFRRYATPEDGATDVAKHVLKQRPITASVLADPKGTIYRASFAMRRERYYGGFCPKATARYGAEVANSSFAHPDRDEGTKACQRECVELHAKTVGKVIQAIAAAIGKEPMRLGTYEDAEKWYASRAQQVSGRRITYKPCSRLNGIHVCEGEAT